jgi:secreted PhoX family phosphatase
MGPNDSRPAGASGSSFDEVVAAQLSRRGLLQAGAGGALLAFLGCGDDRGQADSGPLLGFSPVPTSRADELVVPPEYTWQLVNAWGDPIVAGGPAWKSDVSQSAADQALQAGMHHDGMMFFPLPAGSGSSTEGLLAINFEYTDDNILTPEGQTVWTAEKVQKSKNAHGIGVMHLRLEGGTWRVVPDSKYGRRITADSPITLRGPAAGHPWMVTEADPEGRTVRGTFNNCSAGRTPWGTYLSCEENVTPYFVNDSGNISRLHDRYGVGASKDAWGFRWHEFDPRFDAALHPNEPNRFGWVVEVDPFDPQSTPIKRTALGRIAHEGATVAVARDGRVVVYMGDDDYRSKFEHIYKFVSRKPHVRGGGLRENMDILDEGTLYVARFDSDGTGVWVALEHGQNGLDDGKGYPSQAEVLIDARTAADLVGGTYMDRPEWIALHPRTGELYCTLSNNTSRGTGKPLGQAAVLGAEPANPRAPNLMGHIIRWQEQGGDAAATRFAWSIFLQAGDPQNADPAKQGNVAGQVAFAQPDGLYFDPRGLLWIQTDSSVSNLTTPDWERIGNNQMLAANPDTGEVRRFLTGPVNSEITGVQMTPDQRTLFVNIQHPGEAPGTPGRNDPTTPLKYSSWPDGPTATRPRSATIAIRRKDGGRVGS